MSAWFFHGVYYGGDPLSSTKDYNYIPCGTMSADYTDTSGSPQYGAYDVKISATCARSIWQPFTGGTFLDPISGTDDLYAMDIGAFKYMTISLKPTQNNQVWVADIVSRVPSPPNNDAFNTAGVTLTAPSDSANQWHTYKIPLQGANSMQIGRGTFTGSIKDGKLYVTALVSGIPIEGGSWISGKGIPAGTVILSTDIYHGGPGTSGPGVYSISGPGINSGTNVAETTITLNRTNFYKFTLLDQSSTGSNTYFIDNVGFTNY